MTPQERPVLFNEAMVRAIVDGRKSVTRRPVTVPWSKGFRCQPYEPWFVESDGELHVDCSNWKDSFGGGDYREFASCMPCPFGRVGDRLWVRETWAIAAGPRRGIDLEPMSAKNTAIVYREDWNKNQPDLPLDGCWSPSIHMPKWAARIWLQVLSVRVERLHEITESDAKLEGMAGDGAYGIGHIPSWQRSPRVYDFSVLWEDVYAKRGLGWNVNPWVWRIEFKRSA